MNRIDGHSKHNNERKKKEKKEKKEDKKDKVQKKTIKKAKEKPPKMIKLKKAHPFLRLIWNIFLILIICYSFYILKNVLTKCDLSG